MPKFIKNSYFLFVLIFSGLATSFYRSQEGIIVLFLISVLIILYYQIAISKQFQKAIIVWLSYSILVTVVNWSFHDFFIFRHICYITVAFTLIMLFKDDIFEKYEKTIYGFAIISLIFWFWQLTDFSSFNLFMNNWDIGGLGRSQGISSKNIIVYTLHHYYTPGDIPRNCGFTWEPGPFSIYLNIAILINLFRTDIQLKRNWPLWIMFITVLTTQSTTGYLAIGLLFIYIAFSKYKGEKKYIVFVPVFLLFLYIFINLEFMYDKIINLYESGQNIQETINFAKETGTSHSGGRFGGFIIGWENLKNYPLFGIGGSTHLSVSRSSEANVAIINGIAHIMSTYGLFGLTIYSLFLFKSSSLIAQYYNSKLKYSFFIIMLISSFAFTVHNQVLLFTLIFSSVFYKKIMLSKYLQKANM